MIQTTISRTFIYKPKSGDRVFAESPNSRVAVFTLKNGCRVVVGGCPLAFYAAEQGCYYRQEGAALAAQIVRACGGVAWDEQGTIGLVVPRWTAGRAWRLLHRLDQEARRRQPRLDLDNVGALAGAGYPLSADLGSVDTDAYVQDQEVDGYTVQEGYVVACQGARSLCTVCKEADLAQASAPFLEPVTPECPPLAPSFLDG